MLGKACRRLFLSFCDRHLPIDHSLLPPLTQSGTPWITGPYRPGCVRGCSERSQFIVPARSRTAVLSLTLSYGSSQPAQPSVPPHSDLHCSHPINQAQVMALLCFASLRLLQRHADPLVSSPGNCCICLRSVHSYSHDALLEVATEGVGFVVLDLTVLHRAASQVVIQLCGIDGRAALLVLGRVLPDPKVDVLGEKAAHSPGLGCSQRGGVRSRFTSAILLTSLVWEGSSMPYATGLQGKAPSYVKPFFLCAPAQKPW